MPGALSDIGEQLGSFLPLELLGQIYGRRGELPAAVEFSAAVMFVDVSRYTALVEQLARRGQGGLERIPNLLSRSYARCVEQVYELGGEVLSLAGDTLLAYWSGEVDGLGNAVRAASNCAKHICKDRSNWSDAAAGDIEPALHIGVGAGRLWVAAVGGEPLWNLVAGGEAVTGAARAQASAKRWEYALSQRAELELNVNKASQDLDIGPRLGSAAVPQDVAWLSGFLPVQLRGVVSGTELAPGTVDGEPNIASSRRSATSLDALAEIRPITALFARISGLDHRGSDALERHQQLCAALQEDIRARGGPAGELVYDDKGLIFLATFGAHGSFHRNDASRAVDTARAISVTAQRLGLTASVGLATGEAFFRVVGNARRRQLMVLGTPMNRAARLMTAVSGDIYCDAPTERASRSAFAFEKCGSLQLAGLGDTAAVFRPLQPRTTAPAQASLIGRRSELELLNRAFDETRDGDRRLVVVLGEPGIGKTRLVDSFMYGLQSTANTVCVARAERDDRRTSLLPWRRVLASLLGLEPNADGSDVLEAILPRVEHDPALARRLPLLDGVLGVSLPQNEATRHLEGAYRADATMRLLADLIDTLAPRPLVVVLEDSQWLDSASWRLVEWILASLSSLLLVLCVRSEEVPEELKNLRRRVDAARANAIGIAADDPAHFCRILDLQELSDDLICELVARTLGGAPAQDELARRVAELAGGNPFFAEEITLALKSEGLIAVRDGLWRPIRSLDSLRYFESVERVIRERVDRLESSAQSALKAAAVIGRSFSAEALAAILTGERRIGDTGASVELLVAANLVRQKSDPGDYEFRHDKIRDVVYGAIPGDVRQRLHEALALWMESTHDAGADISLLVQHFQAAGNKEKAVKYADIAATKALQIGAYREVESFLEICFSHEPKQQSLSTEQHLRAVRWRGQLGEAHYRLGDIRGQSVWVRRALTLAGEPIPSSQWVTLGRLAKKAFQLAVQQVFPPKSGQTPSNDRLAWERELARCLNLAVVVDYFELRYLRAFYHAVAAVTHAERTGLSMELVLASAQLGCAFGIIKWRLWAAHFIERAERVAIALADPIAHARVCNNDALWRIGHGEWAMVEQRVNQSQAMCLAAGDQLTWCSSQAIRFWSQHYRGDLGALEHTAQELLARAQNSGNIQQEIWALRCKALSVLQADNPREAVDVLRLVTSAMPGTVDRAEQVTTKGMLALALARVGLHDESVQIALETLQVLRAMGRPTAHSMLPGISGIAEVFLRGREAGLAREYDQWRRWERRAIYELKRYRDVFPVGAPQHGLWLGVAQWLDGRHAQAFVTWKQAITVAQRLGLRKDESMIAAEIRHRQDWD